MFAPTLPLLLGSLGPILFGIAVLVAVRLLSGPLEPMAGDPVRLVLSVIGWVQVIVGLMALCVGLLGPFFGIIGLIVVGMVYYRHRTARQHALLWSLAVAAERLMPLAPAVEAFASERPLGLGWRARRLARMLNAGVPLPDALEQTGGLVPADALIAIRVGYRSGALAQAIRQAVTLRQSREPLWTQITGKFLYLVILTLFAMLVVTFISLKLLPAFSRIFQDFDVELPAITQAVIAATSAFASYWPLIVLPLVVLLSGLFLHLVFGYIGFFDFGVPGIDWFGRKVVGRLGRRLDTAAIFEALALVAERRRPLPEGIDTLARSYPKPAIRQRLLRALQQVEAGADWCGSLARQGLMTGADLAVLQAAQRVGNLPWALREMADSNRRRLAYRLHVLVQLLFPVVIALYALTVGIIVVAYFLP